MGPHSTPARPTRVCRRCNLEKALDAYNVVRRPRGGVVKVYPNSYCRACGVDVSRDWRKRRTAEQVEADRERCRLRKRAAYSDPRRRAKMLAAQRVYDRRISLDRHEEAAALQS
jgi:hypothetical protein